MNSTKIEILATGLKFPEGPAFDTNGALWVVELQGESLIKYHKNKLTRYAVGGAPNGIAIDKENNIWFCDSQKNAIRKFNPYTEQCEIVAAEVDGERLNKPNDLAFDRNNNLLFTCPGDSRKEPIGYVCVLMNDGSIKKISDNKFFPNGLAFTSTGNEFILAETYRHRLWKCKWDTETGAISDSFVWCDIGGPEGPGGPDGMAFDTNGNLYTAVFGTGEIRITNTEGRCFDAITLPGRNPTNCAFDPGGLLGLAVTEAEKGLLLSVNYK